MSLQKTLSTNFPHKNRIKTEASLIRVFDYILWLIIIFFILINLLHTFLFPFTEEKKLKRQIMQIPQRSSFHEKLGQYYLSFSEEEAAKEYQLANELYKSYVLVNTDVLGSQSSPEEVWGNIKSKRQSMEEELKKWERINKALPDYLYAQIKIATLNHQLGNEARAKKYLNDTLQEVPTDEILLGIIQKWK